MDKPYFAAARNSSVRAALLRPLAFVLLFAAMYGVLAISWGAGLSHWVIDLGTVVPAAWFARAMTGDPAIAAMGSHLSAPDVSINVLFGCEGSDVLMLLCAALLVSPSPAPKRLAGLVAGIGLVFLINQARLLALFFVFRHHRGWFGTVHGLVGPMSVVVGVTAFFLLWLRWTQAPRVADGTAA